MEIQLDSASLLAIPIVIGIAAQWLAWRLRLPAILVLLLAGLLVGPGLGFLHPDEILGPLLPPLVGYSVAVILFEGGLSLRIRDLPEIGSAVRNLVTIGVLATWALTTLGAVWIIGLNLPLAVLFAAILVVTGPTVIGPLLRHVRPVGKVGGILQWEGILNDPIGALLAVLVFEATIAGGSGHSVRDMLVQMAISVSSAAVIGALAAGVLVLLIRFYWIADFLQNAMALCLVLITFSLSNGIQAESGLLATTVMGIVLANQKIAPVRSLVAFKEDLRVLLISTLFVVLAARLKIGDLAAMGWREALFLLLLMLVIRPAAVAVSTIGAGLAWKERLFLSWMAPRGIVAAAVSSVFGAQLLEAGDAQAGLLVPLTFLVIIATVSVYGLTAAPLARRLGLADANPQGALILGAHRWAREIGAALRDAGLAVRMIDSDWQNVAASRLKGFPTHFGSVLSRPVLDNISLHGIGKLLALTSNDEANSLACMHFRDHFGREHAYQLPPNAGEKDRHQISAGDFRGRILFGAGVNYDFLSKQFDEGAVVKTTPISKEFTYASLRSKYGPDLIPLFIVSAEGRLRVITASATPEAKAGDSVIGLLLRPDRAKEEPERKAS